MSALLVELERAKAQLESKVVETALLRERVDELKARERISQEERSRLMAMLEQSQRLLAAPVLTQRAPVRKKAAVAPVAAPVPPASARAPARKKIDAPVPVATPARARSKATSPASAPAVPAKARTASKSRPKAQ